MAGDRSYRLERADSSIDLKNTFVEIDNEQCPRPVSLSLENLNNILQIKVNEDFINKKLENKNLSCIEFINQDTSPYTNPFNYNISQQTFLSVDENYLYVWIPTLKKWKRIPLLDWI